MVNIRCGFFYPENHTAYKNGIEISGSWKPFAIKPNTMYTINAEIKIREYFQKAHIIVLFKYISLTL